VASKLAIRVIPNARQSGVAGWMDDADGRPVLKLRIAAPPVDGAANAAIVQFLAKALGVTKACVRLDKGATGRNKLVEIDGFDKDSLVHRINEILSCPKL
jgi:hypothetical protein